MRKNLNQVKICGRVYGFGDANGRQALELKTTGANSKNPGTQFIGGILQVAVDDEGLNVIPVHFTYVTETFGTSGKTNNSFGILKKIIEENKTWVTVGAENATMVQIDASIALNDFYNNENQLVSTKIVEGSFVKIVNTLDNAERNTFRADMLITSAVRTEADPENNIPADFVTVRGAVFNFRNAVLPLEFVVRNATGMEYFEDLNASQNEPVYTKVWGTINCQTKVTELREESAFGDAAVRTFTKTTRDWVITGTSTTPYEFDSEETITAAELTKALQDREVYLADVKKKADDYKNSAKPAAAPAPAATKAAPGKFNF